MADKFSNNIEPIGFHMSLDRLGYVGDLVAGPSLRDAQVEGVYRDIH